MGPDLGSLLERPVLEVAPLLLGATLRHGDVAVRLTEVEAYDGANDPGSHGHRGRTARNSVMFGPAGHLYVYFTYGMHHCCNVVCGSEGAAAAVLLRAGEVVDGLETARQRRPRSSDRDLARGPARLCRALGIDLDQNGARLDAPPAHPPPGARPGRGLLRAPGWPAAGAGPGLAVLASGGADGVALPERGRAAAPPDGAMTN